MSRPQTPTSNDLDELADQQGETVAEVSHSTSSSSNSSSSSSSNHLQTPEENPEYQERLKLFNGFLEGNLALSQQFYYQYLAHRESNSSVTAWINSEIQNVIAQSYIKGNLELRRRFGNALALNGFYQEDDDVAIPLLEEARQLGSVYALFFLARIYERQNFPNFPKKMIQLYEQATTLNCAPAMVALADIYLRQAKAVATPETIRLYRRAAKLNNNIAKRRLNEKRNLLKNLDEDFREQFQDLAIAMAQVHLFHPIFCRLDTYTMAEIMSYLSYCSNPHVQVATNDRQKRYHAIHESVRRYLKIPPVDIYLPLPLEIQMRAVFLLTGLRNIAQASLKMNALSNKFSEEIGLLREAKGNPRKWWGLRNFNQALKNLYKQPLLTLTPEGEAIQFLLNAPQLGYMRCALSIKKRYEGKLDVDAEIFKLLDALFSVALDEYLNKAETLIKEHNNIQIPRDQFKNLEKLDQLKHQILLIAKNNGWKKNQKARFDALDTFLEKHSLKVSVLRINTLLTQMDPGPQTQCMIEHQPENNNGCIVS